MDDRSAILPTTLKSCCQKIVDTYLTLFNPPRDLAALYCRCGVRIVRRDGAWTEETAA